MSGISMNELLSRFDKVKKTGTDQWQCCCPCHDDKNASLSIGIRNGKKLFFCHAGCATENILNAVGLTFDDIEENERPKIPEWKVNLIAEYKYTDKNGNYLFSKLRYPDGKGGKKMLYGRTNGSDMTWGKGDQQSELYNLVALQKAIKSGETVYYAEGEKDVDTLRKIHLTAASAGGTEDWKADYARHFTGAKVVILADNDKPGKTLADKVKHSLHAESDGSAGENRR